MTLFSKYREVKFREVMHSPPIKIPRIHSLKVNIVLNYCSNQCLNRAFLNYISLCTFK